MGWIRVPFLYGRKGMTLALPDSVEVLESQSPPALKDPVGATFAALAEPIGSPPLAELIAARRPASVAITISDITRPVPNRVFLPPLLQVLNSAGIVDDQVTIIVGTGMHRPSTDAERIELVGKEILDRIEVVDHTADDPSSLRKFDGSPPVSICRHFADADFRIVTGYIEPHFMAGFSGGRKGVCPALVDLSTIQRFHGFETLNDPEADCGVLSGNPCHDIALSVARRVGVDFLFNVSINRNRDIAGIYCGDLVAAHEVGCKEVGSWTTASIDGTFDLVVTNGGGYPLDQTFYQTVKGMCTALPALGPETTMLQVSECAEGVGSAAYTELMMSYRNDWPRFLADIGETAGETRLDQWEFQMQCRVLSRIGIGRLIFASDGIPPHQQAALCVTPVPGKGDLQTRVQAWLDEYCRSHPETQIAAIPEGPYTMLERCASV